MVQKEFAQRCIASKNSKDYSSFTLFVQYHSKPRIISFVSPTCFFPAPKVASAILELIPTQPPVNCPNTILFSVIRSAFQQRRKMLRSSLRNFASPQKIEGYLKLIGLDPTERPQNLKLEDFSALTLLLTSPNKK